MDFYEKWEQMSPESKIAVAALFKGTGIDIEKEILSLCERKSGEPDWIGSTPPPGLRTSRAVPCVAGA